MKVQVNRDVLAEAVAWAARVIPGRPALPVLSGLLLEAGEEELRVAAFDYDVSARAEIEAEVAEPGRVLLPGRVLAEIVKSLPGRPVEIVTTGAEAVLTCGTAEFGLLTMPVEDFPTLPQLPPRLGAIGGGGFVAIRILIRSWFGKTRAKYEARRNQQRRRFGHDVSQRAKTSGE